MANRLATDAAMIKRNRKVRLWSCSLAIFRTSFGWDDKIIIQSMIIMVAAQAIQVDNANDGPLVFARILKNTIALMINEITRR